MNVKKNNFLKEYPSEFCGLLESFQKIGKQIFQDSWEDDEWEFSDGNYLEPKEAKRRLAMYWKDACEEVEGRIRGQEFKKNAIEFITQKNTCDVHAKRGYPLDSWDISASEARKITINQKEIDDWIGCKREWEIENLYQSKINLGQNPNSLSDFRHLRDSITKDKDYVKKYTKNSMCAETIESLRKIIRENFVRVEIHDKLNKHLPQKTLDPERVDGFKFVLKENHIRCLGGSGNYDLKVPRRQLDYVLKTGKRCSDKDFNAIKKESKVPSRFTKMIKSLKAKPEYNSWEKLWEFLYAEAEKGTFGNQDFRAGYDFTDFEIKQGLLPAIKFKTADSKSESSMQKSSFKRAYNKA